MTRAFRACDLVRVCLALLVSLLPNTLVRAASPTPLPDPHFGVFVNGTVTAIAYGPDGSMYFGGNFSLVNEVPRADIAKLRPDGTLDLSWNPGTDGPTYALAVAADGTVFAGGAFSRIGGVDRSALAKLSGSSGAVDPDWDPSPNNTVSAIALGSDGTVYVGGYFWMVGTELADYVAKLSSTGSGSRDTSWNPSPDAPVSSLALSPQGDVYVSGSFNSIGGAQRRRVAKLAGGGTGASISAWDAQASGFVNTLAVNSSGDVFVGGSFSLGGVPQNVAKLSATTGTPDAAWKVVADNQVMKIALDSGDGLYAAGWFHSIGGQSRIRLAKLSQSGTASVDPDWNPGADNSVAALAVDADGDVAAGGYFTSVGGATRRALAVLSSDGTIGPAVDAEVPGVIYTLAPLSDGSIVAGGRFDRARELSRFNLLRILPDGSLDPTWSPHVNEYVFAIVVDPADDSIYIGGNFDVVNGAPRTNLAKLSKTAELDTVWAPAASGPFGGQVEALAFGAGSVFVGGMFTSIDGQPRSNIAKLSASGAGAPDPAWSPAPNLDVGALALDSSGALFAGGRFDAVGATPRSHVAKFLASGAVDPTWNPSADGEVRVLAFDGNGNLVVGGAFGSIGGQSRDHVAKLSSTGAGLADAAWDPSADGTVVGLLVDGSAVYAAGAFQQIGGRARSNVAKLDAGGQADPSWNPGADGPVAAVARNNDRIFAGGGFSTFGGQTRPQLAAVSAHAIFDDGFE